MASKIKLTDDYIRKTVFDIYGEKYLVQGIYRNENGDVKIIVHCTNCEAEKEMDYKNFIKGKSVCRCMQPKALKACAREYSRRLYIEPEMGLIVGSELLEYIEQCVAYDYPKLNGSTDFIYYIEDEMLALYEKKGVKKCERCDKWYPKTHFKSKKHSICKHCIEGDLLWTLKN